MSPPCRSLPSSATMPSLSPAAIVAGTTCGVNLVPLLRTTCPYVSAVPFAPLTGYHAFSLTRRDRGRNYVDIDTRLPSIVVMRQRIKLSYTTMHYVSVCLRRAVRSPHRLPCLLSHPPRSWQELRGHRQPAPIHRCDAAAE
ncbi:hypothetical protein J6590_107235 [Homalodisca vitripennis]|nr:hypothetical protein J6590_107235 [Homalodisca vitripennis]